MESRLSERMSELARLLLEEHFARRAAASKEGRIVEDDAGQPLTHVRERTRVLATQFGEVEVSRASYSRRGGPSVRPVDDELELPARRYSYPLQEKAIIACLRDSYDEAGDELARYLGVRIPKRQLQELVQEAGADVMAFYEQRVHEGAASPGSVLVVQADGKGIPMLQRDLRPATQKAALSSKLEGRASKGEKRHRKREACVGVVFSTEHHPRTCEQVIGGVLGMKLADPPTARVRPPVTEKRVWGTAEQTKDEFFYDLTAEALRHAHSSQIAVFLVDGASAFQRPGAEILVPALRDECAEVHVFVDLIHVAEYLWDAAWCFYEEGDRDAELWVVEKMRALLEGRSSRVAASLRATATRRGLTGRKRERVDRTARYLLNNKEYLRYDIAIAKGLPMTTSAVEGACKNLVADRFERSGARWSLRGAEALLALRGVYRSKDWKEFWAFHIEQEKRRLQEQRPDYDVREKRPHLRVIQGGKASS